MRIDALDYLAVELQYQTQHAVSRRMLGPEIEGRDGRHLCVLVRSKARIDHKHAYAPHPRGLLRACRERPRRRRAAKERDELASFHVWMAPAWQEKM
jgi:hypothetical protein